MTNRCMAAEGSRLVLLSKQGVHSGEFLSGVRHGIFFWHHRTKSCLSGDGRPESAGSAFGQTEQASRVE